MKLLTLPALTGKYAALIGILSLMVMHKSFGQEITDPPLEREVTISVENQAIETVLSDISRQTGVIFSYNPKAINTTEKTTLHRKNKQVRIILDDMFSDDISYKTRGKYIILKKGKVKSDIEKEMQRIEGYVYDSQTGGTLTEASIYDNQLEASAITDKYGYFSIEIPSNKSITSLRVSKAGYADTMLLTNHIDKKIQTIEIISKPKDTLSLKKIFSNIDLPKLTPQWLIPKKLKINSINISDPVLSFAQFSLAPMLSTNRFMSGNSLNKLSFNATVGYVQGVEIAEFGGIINIDLGDVKYAQFAGVANFVGGNFTGYQSAGTMNFAKSVKGVQNSGVINVSAGNADVQFAGVGNFATTNLVQAAGVINIAEETKVQAAGVVNKTNEAVVQAAGVLNLAQNVQNVAVAGVLNFTENQVGEAQVAGVLNIASKVRQAQVSGCVNIAKENVGVQVTSLVNIASYAKQSQIALINIADSTDGIPIGILSIVKNGYHKLEWYTDEILSTQISYRTGVKKFHTSLGAGISYLKTPYYNFSYGLGISFGRNPKLLYDLDFNSRILFGKNYNTYAGYLHTLYFGLDRKLAKKLSLACGVTYNLHFTNSLNKYYKPEYAQLAPYSLSNFEFTNSTRINTWIGGRVALRFF